MTLHPGYPGRSNIRSPVLPIVLYNGFKPWDAARDVGALIAPAPPFVREYCPRQGYDLIEEIRLAEQDALPVSICPPTSLPR
ncbi:hypothetical protein [Thiocapsa imhoffii]|uniref:hypothetical protein n=1 Tax=Thiocapsa imhoffii TaxID=382777 RepID=UPI00190658D1|nr:hypothetical protein [Thiocapsa imhoffii]